MNVLTENVPAIMAELPGTWTILPAGNEWYLTARRADGLELGFHTEWNQTTRARVSVHGAHEHVRYNESRPAINVTVTRKASTVAADIMRRLMADAETFHATIVDRIAMADAYENRISENREALEEAGGVALENDRPRIHIGNTWGDVRVSRDSVTLELHDLTVDQAGAILALIRSTSAVSA